VVAGLEGDVCGAAFEAVGCIGSHPFSELTNRRSFDFAQEDGAPSSLQGGDFGVVDEVVLVPAFAGDLPRAVEDDAAYGGVGRGDGDAAAG
jgi:hypothetical protein